MGDGSSRYRSHEPEVLFDEDLPDNDVSMVKKWKHPKKHYLRMKKQDGDRDRTPTNNMVGNLDTPGYFPHGKPWGAS